MNRRSFLKIIPSIALLRSSLAANAPHSRIGLCTFSCHQQWKAVSAKQPGVQFSDTITFYRYARKLGADGVQTALRSKDVNDAHRLRTEVEKDGGYYEGELRLPKTDADLSEFEADVRLVKEAGATVARSVFMGQRRYEVFKTLEDFQQFHAQARKSLMLIEPLLRKHRMKLAVENHKDFTFEELIKLMREFSSEWIGVLVDTGNNIALLDEPHDAVNALAPYAFSTHFKDMAVQPAPDGFLLSEVVLGEGFLRLSEMAATLVKANSSIVFNLEMATRDPLSVPCLMDRFWATFPERKSTHLQSALDRVKANLPKQAVPTLEGKSVERVLAEEQSNNQTCLQWMRLHL